MTFFNKREIRFLGIIFLLLLFVSFKGYVDAKKRERDITRMLDLGNVATSLEKYRLDYDIYPLSTEDGKIVACVGEHTDYLKDKKGELLRTSKGKLIRTNLIPCEWGKDQLFSDEYLEILPKDTQVQNGVKYIYVSDGKSYHLYGSYETKEMSDFSESLKALKVLCGSRECNVEKVSQNPLLENSAK